jgi:hypothetical protein
MRNHHLPAIDPGSKMINLKPMDAVDALYSSGQHELSEEIVASLSRFIFSESESRPAGWIQRTLARVSYRVLQWTTTSTSPENGSGSEVPVFSNKLMERSRHPYARSLLGSSRSETATLMEGGDPMNGNYMMLAPEIRLNGGLWDRLFLDSVQGKDVRLRMVLETRATYEAARRRLEEEKPVRLKAVAAGTGLSMILVYDRLIREGYHPHLLTATITDWEEANIAKANRLMDKLATTRERNRSLGTGSGISAETEDIFANPGNGDAACTARYDVLTAIGILEYFQGFSYRTTEQRLHLKAQVEAPAAQDLARRLYDMTTDRASLIVNTCRDDASTRILELFGRKFDYRNREGLRSLLTSVNFQLVRLVGSGNIYDVEIYEKTGSCNLARAA